jgi:hypothetical protein
MHVKTRQKRYGNPKKVQQPITRYIIYFQKGTRTHMTLEGTLRKPHEYLVDEHGTKKAVVIPIEEYEELLEDLYDIAVVLERKDETPITLAEFKKWLEDEGLL